MLADTVSVIMSDETTEKPDTIRPDELTAEEKGELRDSIGEASELFKRRLAEQGPIFPKNKGSILSRSDSESEGDS